MLAFDGYFDLLIVSLLDGSNINTS